MGQWGQAPLRPGISVHLPKRCCPSSATGRDALVASVYGTQMLRIRRSGKDRCGYDTRNTGLRHNRSLPRYQDGDRRGRSNSSLPSGNK